MVARLREGDFQGRDWETVAGELIKYGIDVIGGWIRSGRIVAQCRRRGIRGLSASGLCDLRREDADDLTMLVVAEAICAFREVLRRSGWSSAGNTRLTTYFIGQCLIRFPDVHRRWRREARPAAWTSLDGDEGPYRDIEDPLDMTEDAVQRLDVARHLRRLDERTRQAVRMSMSGYSHRQIADRLGTTPNAITALLHRYRQRFTRKGGI